MTSAHRPTFTAAIASSGGGYNTFGTLSHAVSVKDLPGYLTLKTRQVGQGAKKEVEKRDLKVELERRERAHFDQVEEAKAAADPTVVPDLKLLTDAEVKEGEEERKKQLSKYDDSDDDDSEDDSEEDDSDDDDDEEEAELLRELEKIKREREEERKRKEDEAQESADLERKEAMLRGNPLLSMGEQPAKAAVKRRWDHDTVFKNQARDAPKPKKRFINDTVRSDFHRNFLRRYVK
mmetsp:Transcript_855/g.2437  ORF Transcript_855/g.2437 Transcript_855/m.2437 type:complete len:235 (-) Transcript_855:36-740(-)